MDGGHPGELVRRGPHGHRAFGIGEPGLAEGRGRRVQFRKDAPLLPRAGSFARRHVPLLGMDRDARLLPRARRGLWNEASAAVVPGPPDDAASPRRGASPRRSPLLTGGCARASRRHCLARAQAGSRRSRQPRGGTQRRGSPGRRRLMLSLEEARRPMPPTRSTGAPATRAAWGTRIRVRFALRGKILLFTVLPVVTLVTGALWMVNRSISRQV